MPSRFVLHTQPTPSPIQPPLGHQFNKLPSEVVPPLAAAASSFLVLLLFCFRKVRRQRTVPADAKSPHRYSYSTLRRATNSFSPSLILGQGGFGSVYRGTLSNRVEIAVKVMDSGSLQGEREFQNELLLASKVDSSHVVSVLGFSSDRKRRGMLLVYQLMHNGNLQDALLHRKCAELQDWGKRFAIAVDIAKGIQYLHTLDPPVIHGDIKPSNVLLDQHFSAKIADFGLARLKSESRCEVTVEVSGETNVKTEKKAELESNCGGTMEGYGSLVEDTESMTTATGLEDFHSGFDQSPEPFPATSHLVTLAETLDVVAPSPHKNIGLTTRTQKESKVQMGKSNSSKDYVMEWIGKEIKNEKPKSNWIGASSSTSLQSEKKNKKHNKHFDWWLSLDDELNKGKKKSQKEKSKPVREWWKEEYREELEKKKKKKTRLENEENWCPGNDEEMNIDRKKKKHRSTSRSSIDYWLDRSGEFLKGSGNSHNSFSGDIPGSTPSMRGTVCYVAPEYGGSGGDTSEKCDVYSFGVLLLVLIAGRRPLQVTASPLSEFKRANLISWARHLARAGKLLDLVDKNVELTLNREQARVCIMVALLCLQKLPALRPSMKEVVGMLTGETEMMQLPTEFSPSPPSRVLFTAHKEKKAK